MLRLTPLWMLAACASAAEAPPDALPDAPAGHDLTISLFKHVPFVDGDTASAPLAAVQDGDGAWTAVTAPDGVYHAHVTSDRYGVAIGCRDGVLSVRVLQRTASDGLEVRARGCVPTTVELDVEVHHVPAGSIAFVSTLAGAAGGGDATYGFAAAPGPTEVFASLSAGGAVTKLLRIPAFDLQASRKLIIDFATQGVAPETRTVAVTLDAATQARLTSSVVRPSGEYALHAPAAIGSQATYAVLPAALQMPDDLSEVTVGVDSRSATYVNGAPKALAVDLPAAFAVQPPAVLVAPSLHPVFAFLPTNPTLAVQGYALSADTIDASSKAHRWSAELSGSWIAGAAVQYAFPDLSSVEGFAPELALSANGPLRWSVRRTDASTAALADGRVLRAAVQSGAVGYCGDHVIEAPEACDPPEDGACTSQCTKP